MRLLHAGDDPDGANSCWRTIRIPTDHEIRHGLEGNLCRCTGYQHIVNAVKAAAAKAGA